MYDEEEYVEEEPVEDEEDQEEISLQHSWTVIGAYFDDKGLVTQQLESFNEFIRNTVQEIVNENGDVTIKPNPQHTTYQIDDDLEERETHIKFEQIYISKPTVTEANGESTPLYPKDARLRSLTQVASL